MDAYLRSPELRSVFIALTSYLTDDPGALSASTAIPLFTFYFEGGHFPRGGSQVIADTLATSIRSHQGALRLRTPVSRIVIEQSRATGVELADGEVLRGRAIISNADIIRTFMELVGRDHLPAYFADRISRLQPSCSAFQLFLGVDYVPSLEPISFHSLLKKTGVISCPSKLDSSLAPPGHAALSIISLVAHQEASAWRRDEPGYKARKVEYSDDLIASLEEVLPGLRNHIVFREEATPATVIRYAGTTGGAIYGLALDQWHPAMRSPVGALYLAGAGTTTRPGVEDAVHSGLLAAAAVCDQLGYPREKFGE